MSARCKYTANFDRLYAAFISRLPPLTASSKAPMCHRMASISSSVKFINRWMIKIDFSPCPAGKDSVLCTYVLFVCFSPALCIVTGKDLVFVCYFLLFKLWLIQIHFTYIVQQSNNSNCFFCISLKHLFFH